MRKQKMSRLFNIYDADRDGLVNKSDFEQPVHVGATFLGYEPGSAQYEEMFDWSMGLWNNIRNQSGKNENDSISLDEFLVAMDALVNDRATLNQIVMGHASFTIKIWDRDEDGMMSEEEFIAAHTAYNTKEEAAREAFGYLDRDGDRQLSYSEIIQAVEEYFVSDDPDAIGNWFIMD
ncbi:MAG: hypothetical protein AAF702_17985 [Chloroflexota bacterium]